MGMPAWNGAKVPCKSSCARIPVNTSPVDNAAANSTHRQKSETKRFGKRWCDSDELVTGLQKVFRVGEHHSGAARSARALTMNASSMGVKDDHECAAMIALKYRCAHENIGGDDKHGLVRMFPLLSFLHLRSR